MEFGDGYVVLLENISKVLAGALTVASAMEQQSTLLARISLNACPAQSICGYFVRHVLSQLQAHHLSSEQVNHHG